MFGIGPSFMNRPPTMMGAMSPVLMKQQRMTGAPMMGGLVGSRPRGFGMAPPMGGTPPGRMGTFPGYRMGMPSNRPQFGQGPQIGVNRPNPNWRQTPPFSNQLPIAPTRPPWGSGYDQPIHGEKPPTRFRAPGGKIRGPNGEVFGGQDKAPWSGEKPEKNMGATEKRQRKQNPFWDMYERGDIRTLLGPSQDMLAHLLRR
jgi:hypothetical protein